MYVEVHNAATRPQLFVDYIRGTCLNCLYVATPVSDCTVYIHNYAYLGSAAFAYTAKTTKTKTDSYFNLKNFCKLMYYFAVSPTCVVVSHVHVHA